MTSLVTTRIDHDQARTNGRSGRLESSLSSLLLLGSRWSFGGFGSLGFGGFGRGGRRRRRRRGRESESGSWDGVRGTEDERSDEVGERSEMPVL